MKKLHSLWRLIAAPALVLGTLTPLIVGGSTALAAGTLTWCGAGADALVFSSPKGSSDLSDHNNWITSGTDCSTNNPGGLAWASGMTLQFETANAAENLVNTPDVGIGGSLAGIEVVSGGITLSQPTTWDFAPGATLLVDTPSTATNYLHITGGLRDSGALTLDGFDARVPANLLTANPGDVVGPLTLTVSDAGVTTGGSGAASSSSYVWDGTELAALMNSPAQVNFGTNTGLNLLASDLSPGTGWTLQADPGGTITLTGGSGSGTNYAESFVGNGGTFAVVSGSGTATVASMTLTANSFADVVGATDVLAATTFTPNSFSFAYPAASSDQGFFPPNLPASPSSGNGSSTTDAGAPDTGFALVRARLVPALVSTLFAAAVLIAVARKLKPAKH